MISRVHIDEFDDEWDNECSNNKNKGLNQSCFLTNSQFFSQHQSESESESIEQFFIENNSAKFHYKHYLPDIIDFSSSDDTCDYDTCTGQIGTRSNQLLAVDILIWALQHQCT